MNPDADQAIPDDPIVPKPRRLFLFEPGWRIGVKRTCEREFCFTITPGQDYYHRLHEGELFLERGDERLCLACAERRGLLAYEPRALRESLTSLEFDAADADPDDSYWPADEAGWRA
jgi:hypothetical protein